VSGFSAEWLAQREPHDAAARAVGLVERLRGDGTSAARPNGSAAARARGARADHGPRTIVDLGAGSGANLRWLAPLLGGEQVWNLVDHDEALLAAAARALGDWAVSRGAELRVDGEPRDISRAELVVRGADFSCRVRRARLDLAAELARIELRSRALVTSSALLDLVSARWLEALAHRCRAAAADVYFALTYDGRAVCTPAEPEDAEVLDLFNRHQRGDKGFGPALGPTAAQRALEIFASLGYGVTTHASDWRIPARAAPFQRALLAGWLDAAVEIAPQRAEALRAWHARRLAHVDALRSELVVGHVDLVALSAR
jgi:hypothetical protein